VRTPPAAVASPRPHPTPPASPRQPCGFRLRSAPREDLRPRRTSAISASSASLTRRLLMTLISPSPSPLPSRSPSVSGWAVTAVAVVGSVLGGSRLGCGDHPAGKQHATKRSHGPAGPHHGSPPTSRLASAGSRPSAQQGLRPRAEGDRSRALTPSSRSGEPHHIALPDPRRKCCVGEPGGVLDSARTPNRTSAGAWRRRSNSVRTVGGKPVAPWSSQELSTTARNKQKGARHTSEAAEQPQHVAARSRTGNDLYRYPRQTEY
jgi:hypothetical protein